MQNLGVAFIVTDQQEPHEGILRPFINFEAALESKYHGSFLLLNCSSDLVQRLKSNGLNAVGFNSVKSLAEELENLKPKFIFIDDDLKRLKLLKKINKKAKAKTLCYAQILYGSHSIVNCFDLSPLKLKQKIVYSSMKYVPFSHFSNSYTKLMKKLDLIVANSKTTATFLHSLYGIEVTEVIYPPVDTDVFKPRNPKEKKEITLYLGSHLGDVKKDFVKKIIENSVRDGYFVNLFGNARLALDLKGKGGNSILYHSNLTDDDLAGLYSRSKLTICPQKWELFGLVPVESMSCGTPVLAFNCLGFQETIDASTGWLANNESEFLRILHEVLEKDELSFDGLRSIAVKRFSVGASSEVLLELLEKS
jgi:glycosyltransferase involved in cell wall biosynthesis